MLPLMNITETCRALGFLTANGQPSRNALYRHITKHGPQINGIAFAAQINGRWHGLPEAIARIRSGESERHAA